MRKFSLDAARTCAALFTATFAAAAFAATTPAEQRYEIERAACLDGRSHQDRETCLKEAVNARDAARKEQTKGSPDEWQRNALARCERVRAEDRKACELLAKGQGERSGSVEGGGVIKEIVTPIPAPANPVAPATPAASAAR